MGTCFSNDNDKIQSKKVSKQIKKAKDNRTNLLLIGAGGSGKSTIVRQLRIIHNQEFSEKELESYAQICRSNVLQGMQALLKGAEELDIELKPKNQKHAELITSWSEAMSLELDASELRKYQTAIEELWNDVAIRKSWEQRHLFQVEESAEYFLERIDLLCEDDFMPCHEDILHCRSKSVGIVETLFQTERFKYRLCDVGGQRNERRKWIHFFSNVSAVIFVSAVSEYDQLCFEDNRTNRAKESLILFEEVMNNHYFYNATLVLFLNKTDLLRQKIRNGQTPEQAFPEYSGGANFDAVCDFFCQLYRDLVPHRKLLIHFTCATNTDMFRHVFNCLEAELQQAMMVDSGLI